MKNEEPPLIFKTFRFEDNRTRNNLTPEEQHLLDTALYELRTRYISVASQYI